MNYNGPMSVAYFLKHYEAMVATSGMCVAGPAPIPIAFRCTDYVDRADGRFVTVMPRIFHHAIRLPPL